jgi:SAM-dependent methyltransferase
MLLRLRVALLRLANRLVAPLPGGPRSHDQRTSYEVAKASGSMGAYLVRVGRGDIEVLDYGCGWGGETLWLAGRVKRVVGVDVDQDGIDHANRVLAQSGVGNCSFVHSTDGRLTLDDSTVDAVFSTDCFEHVMDLPLAFGEIYRVLRPGGWLVTRFGPLFQSPFGYHLRWVSQVPYAHVAFGREALLTLRNEITGATTIEPSWQAAGLNGFVFDDFRSAAESAGFQMVRFERIAVKGLDQLARLPRVGKFFVFGVDCAVRKPELQG